MYISLDLLIRSTPLAQLGSYASKSISQYLYYAPSWISSSYPRMPLLSTTLLQQRWAYKHIQVKHHVNGHNPHASNLTLPPSLSHSESSSHNIHWQFDSEQPPSPNLSHSTPSPSPPPSHGEVDAVNNLGDIGMHAEYPQFDQGYIPP